MKSLKVLTAVRDMLEAFVKEYSGSYEEFVVARKVFSILLYVQGALDVLEKEEK